MPFIGNQPALSYTSFAKQDFTTSATTSYTLNQPVANANELALFINFVRQEPTTAYTASGTSLTLTSATSASDDMYCVFLGKAVQTVNPPSGSVGISQLSATGTKDSTTFLRGDNTFASAGGDMTPYFYAYRNASYSISSGSFTQIVFDAEDFDTASGFDTSTGKYTVQTTGNYYFEFSIRAESASASTSQRMFCYLQRTRSGVSIQRANAGLNFQNNYGRSGTLHGSTILDCQANDEITVYYYHETTTGNVTIVEGIYRPTYFLGYKIIE